MPWKWREDELLPIVNQYTYVGVDISKDYSLGMHTYISKVIEIGNGKSQIGKKDAILTDPHLDTYGLKDVF